ncbi:MAG: hypothetical protein ABIN01_03945 [Ferruginibacter sp.]
MVQILRKTNFIAVAVIILCALTACHHYYIARPQSTATSSDKARTVDSMKLQNRYFILRSGEQAYYMNNVSLNEQKNSFRFTLEPLPLQHKLHLLKGRRGKMQYNTTPDDLNVLNEVHFYIDPATDIKDAGYHTVSLDKIYKIEIIEKDKKRTTNSYVAGTLGIVGGVAVLAAIIIAATKSSCPFVSAYDGSDFTLQGEIYGGAILPQLARHDYLPLDMQPLADQTLQLKITNELQEHQFTDIAELLVITHDKNSRVYADEYGNLSSISSPQPPSLALLNNKKDVTSLLTNAGDNALLYMDDTTEASAINEVILQFHKPIHTTSGKLFLNLKNSYFLDLLYGELAKGFGSYYPTYIKQQKGKPVEELLKWTREQRIPLNVSIKTTSGWKHITDITTIGPLAARSMVLAVNLPETNDPFTEIKLSGGFAFWEIDQVAMDYSSNNSFTVERLSPSSATDELNHDVLTQLKTEDGNYLSQPDIGNSATISYQCKPLVDESKTRSYILHSKGYYEHKRNFGGKPNVAFLNRFKNAGAFPVYGLDLYKKLSREQRGFLAGANY